ncbi:unnamed protein product [Lactuca saligna]|uniref:Uncharacterized protein n=1 Tax=Lactuca saligna TaxID=75948 RepID=A0AA35YIQ5_LACSI|nr:unnamed protein product [Lactuca saligna]
MDKELYKGHNRPALSLKEKGLILAIEVVVIIATGFKDPELYSSSPDSDVLIKPLEFDMMAVIAVRAKQPKFTQGTIEISYGIPTKRKKNQITPSFLKFSRLILLFVTLFLIVHVTSPSPSPSSAIAIIDSTSNIGPPCLHILIKDPSGWNASPLSPENEEDNVTETLTTPVVSLFSDITRDDFPATVPPMYVSNHRSMSSVIYA